MLLHVTHTTSCSCISCVSCRRLLLKRTASGINLHLSGYLTASENGQADWATPERKFIIRLLSLRETCKTVCKGELSHLATDGDVGINLYWQMPRKNCTHAVQGELLLSIALSAAPGPVIFIPRQEAQELLCRDIAQLQIHIFKLGLESILGSRAAEGSD